jgi:radical SAM-linked protein
LPVKVIDGRPTAIAPSHEEFERVIGQPLLCYNCGLECDLTVSRQHLDKALALHKEVRSYTDRIAALGVDTGGADNAASVNGSSQFVQLSGIPRPGGILEPAPVAEAAAVTGTTSVPEEAVPGIARIPACEASQAQTNAETRSSTAPVPAVQSSSTKPKPVPSEKLFRYRSSYSKMSQVKYISHLDMTRALPRAFRRARITLGYSQGFHPMPLIQYGPALGVGCEGENELLEFHSPDRLTEDDFLIRLNQVLPSGLTFRSLDLLSAEDPSLTKLINRAEYIVGLDAAEISGALSRLCSGGHDLSRTDTLDLQISLVDRFLARDSYMIVRAHKAKRQNVDVRRFTIKLEVDVDSYLLRLVTLISPNGGVKPVEVVAAVYDLTDDEKLSLNSRIKRTRLYSDDSSASPVEWIPGRRLQRGAQV